VIPIRSRLLRLLPSSKSKIKNPQSSIVNPTTDVSTTAKREAPPITDHFPLLLVHGVSRERQLLAVVESGAVISQTITEA